MNRLRCLWEMADENEIYVCFERLQQKRQGLLGMYTSDTMTIFLDEALKFNLRFQLCILAEQLGFILTRPRAPTQEIYTAYQRYGGCNEVILMAPYEHDALYWASDFLIPEVELCQALSEGCRNCHELAEYFQITEWMVHRKLNFIKACFRRQGLKVKGRDIFDVQLKDFFFRSTKIRSV